jgi:serine protease inhibitor
MKTINTAPRVNRKSGRVNILLIKFSYMTTLALLILGVTLVSCRKQEISAEDPFNLPEKSAEVITADNTFGLELFRKITAQAGPTDNTMISPLSISLALAMTYNGAEGATKTEMEKTLKLHGLTTEQINNSHKALLAALKSADPDVLLEIANAIFHRHNLTVKNSFTETNRTNYDATVSPLNFDDSDALDIINGWVAQKTRGKIPTIIDRIDNDLVMVLLNAVYFNGIWKYKFDESKTHELPFMHGDGQMKDVETMSQEASLEYTANDLFSAIHIPYGKGQFRMTVILPNTGKSTSDVLQLLTIDRWNGWMKEFRKEEKVEVTMPRFKFSWEMELNDILSAMGMTGAFDPALADFSGITGTKDLYIGFVKHKTFVDVNENGTEAAAVTAVGMFTTSMPVDEPKKIYFKADRPFLFAITENTTGTILFMGEMRAPVY